MMTENKNLSSEKKRSSETEVHLCPTCTRPLHPMAGNKRKCSDCEYEESIN